MRNALLHQSWCFFKEKPLLFDYLGLLQVTGSFIILTTLYPTQLSPVFFPLPLPLHLFSLPLSSSAMFLASRCLTYFLRLLQCSPPLYRENTHIHSEVLNHPPTSTPVPAPLSLGSRIAPAGPLRTLPHWLSTRKPSHRQIRPTRRVLPWSVTHLYFYVTASIIPYNDINYVSDVITVRLRRWTALVVVESKRLKCVSKFIFSAAVLLVLTYAAFTHVQTHSYTTENRGSNISSM